MKGYAKARKHLALSVRETLDQMRRHSQTMSYMRPNPRSYGGTGRYIPAGLHKNVRDAF